MYKCVLAHLQGMPEDTSIRIKVDTWKRLNKRKTLPNESFDDVINDVLDTVEQLENEADEGNPKLAATSD